MCWCRHWVLMKPREHHLPGGGVGPLCNVAQLLYLSNHSLHEGAISDDPVPLFDGVASTFVGLPERVWLRHVGEYRHLELACEGIEFR